MFFLKFAAFSCELRTTKHPSPESLGSLANVWFDVGHGRPVPRRCLEAPSGAKPLLRLLLPCINSNLGMKQNREDRQGVGQERRLERLGEQLEVTSCAGFGVSHFRQVHPRKVRSISWRVRRDWLRAVDNSMTPFRKLLSQFNSFLPDLNSRCVPFILSTQLPAVAFWAHSMGHPHFLTMLSLSAFS